MSVVTLKYCGKCRRFKSRCLFSKDRRAKDGLQSRCKECDAATAAAWYAAHRNDPDYRAKKRESDAAYRRDNAEAVREYSAQYRRDNAATVRESNARYAREHPEVFRAAQRRYRAKKANAPHSPYDPAQYYGLPCYECGAPATVADHVFPLSRPGPLTWDAPWNLLPHCDAHSRRKSNKPPVWYWGQHHRAFDVVRLIQDDAQWFDSEPDWAHVAAGL